MDIIQLAVIGVVAVALVALLIFRQTREYGRQLEQLEASRKKPKEFGVYTVEEVAKHDKPDDAWIIIKHKETQEYRVYNVTEYVVEHPGGDVILRNAGGDATEGFHGPQHPVTTFLMVEEYCIGKLAEGEVPPPAKLA